MKIRLKKAGRYRGFQVGIDAEKESLTVENPEGKPVASLVLEDFLERLGGVTHDFKRQYPRLDLGTHVNYHDADGRLCEAIASTLGGGGLFIEQFSPQPAGTQMRLEIHLPASSKVIPAEGKVVWVRKNILEKFFYPGMGLQFTSISDKNRAEILQFIHKFNRQRGLHEPQPEGMPF
ncbi:MAG TPA: PilZ domain-containing protein [Nitrospiria bacterium]|nr:PilZ domain-containing protein [Nitrospiria bacterium]